MSTQYEPSGNVEEVHVDVNERGYQISEADDAALENDLNADYLLMV